MTTETDAEIWRAIGRLEGKVDVLADKVDDLAASQMKITRRIDRLFFAVLGIGGALFVAIIASRFVG